jgi:uncharacterized protein
VNDLKKKYASLLSFLRNKETAVIAFSGGVDSSFLLKAMKDADMNMLAVTAVSETMPKKDILRSLSFAEKTGVEHMLIQTDELSNDAFVKNPHDRCYYCKDELFQKIRKIAEGKSYDHVFDGSNADDRHDYRPGRKALHLHGVISPLAACAFTKNDIRAVAKELELNIWDSPSSPCLSSRFPYGQKITVSALNRVEKAENFLGTLGVRELRVRDHGDTARIEVHDADMHLFLDPDIRHRVADELRSLGYSFISLDLEGFRSGSLNRTLKHCTLNSEDP